MESKQSAGSPYGNPPPYSSSQPPIGFENSPPAGYPYPGQTTVVTTQPTVAAPQIVVVTSSNCPACHVSICLKLP
ncbi:hypothetical protein Hamer_G001532 [Homarus americanus]|uniref:Uncharacterized protein n=1 Tax=Homarus americanus TaxID=6706 RepID=A0A8J5THP9_HOMAM|nr:hypothetical protein Hamer_G001532 [Homarus americanus]